MRSPLVVETKPLPKLWKRRLGIIAFILPIVDSPTLFQELTNVFLDDGRGRRAVAATHLIAIGMLRHWGHLRAASVPLAKSYGGLHKGKTFRRYRLTLAIWLDRYTDRICKTLPVGASYYPACDLFP